MPRSYSSVYVHLIFCTRKRRPFLTDARLRAEVQAYIGGISKTLGCDPLIVGGVEDHVHILANLGKSVSQSEWIKELKRVSSVWIKERCPSMAEFAWQRGYGAFSVSADGKDAVKQYIENQEEHHRRFSFREEFEAILAEHGMTLDPRDPFDED